MTFSAGTAARTHDGAAQPVASEAQVWQALDASPAPFHASTIGELSQDPDPLALTCEDNEVERSDGSLEPADDDAVIAPSMSRSQRGGLKTRLTGRDAVAAHAARGPPTA